MTNLNLKKRDFGWENPHDKPVSDTTLSRLEQMLCLYMPKTATCG
jgi:hypothetical protein